ncbi:Uncharacterised protein [uncultured archaeon]|nr:Uncharacterised protein [uncultured archaeon]
MHSLEGVIAAMTLLIYFYTATLPPLQKNEWSTNSFKQSGSEYLDAIERANLSMLAADSKTFSEITNQIFETSDIVVTAKGLLDQNIVVGIAADRSNAPVIHFDPLLMMDNATCTNNYGWSTEFGCVINSSNPLGKGIILADTDGGKFDNSFTYDSVYIDMNNNGRYDAGDGPFFVNDYVNISNTLYYIGYIDSEMQTVAFWNATQISKYSAVTPQITINGKNTTLLFYGADMARSISRFDVLVIEGPLDITPYASSLKSFLRQGKGIVEITNITGANYNPVQTDLFGIINTTYGVSGNSNEVHTSLQGVSDTEPLKVGDYFSGISMHVPMSQYSSPPYDVSALPNPAGARVGYLNVSGKSINVAIAVSVDSVMRGAPAYDSLFIDSNGDYNFSNPSTDYSTVYHIGDSFTLASGTYTVREIEPVYGTYADIRPSWNETLLNFFNPLKVDTINASWAAAEEENTYSVSSNPIGTAFAVNLQPAPVLGNASTLPAGDHAYGTISASDSNLPEDYNISVTNVSDSNFFSIDLNHDSRYNGLGDGPFQHGSSVYIGPEEYKVKIANSSSAIFMLYSRKKVPASIASDRYSGKTVWMPDITQGGQDSWNYILASVAWVSPKNGDAVKMRDYKDIVTIRKAAVLTQDMYQPYIIELYRGYRG